MSHKIIKVSLNCFRFGSVPSFSDFLICDSEQRKYSPNHIIRSAINHNAIIQNLLFIIITIPH